MCSSGRTLRALVNARLTAAAEDIFALFERTIAEYEEELRRSKEKEKQQRKQERLDAAVSPGVELLRAGVPSLSPGPALKQIFPESPQIKEEPKEQSVKHEEDQLPVFVPEFIAVRVKTDGSSALQQRQTEHREETQGEDITSEPHFHSETEDHTEHSSEADDDENWRAPLSSSAVQMETEADGDHYYQEQIRAGRTAQRSGLSPQNKSKPENSAAVNNRDMSGTAEEKKHRCHFCGKSYKRKPDLLRHMRIHTGVKPFSCSICQKTFARRDVLSSHEKIHIEDNDKQAVRTARKILHIALASKKMLKRIQMEKNSSV